MSPEMNPEHEAWSGVDCPIIDPLDTATWCWNGPDFYVVPCEYFAKINEGNNKYIQCAPYFRKQLLHPYAVT